MSPGRTPAGRCPGRRMQGQRVTRPALSPVGLPMTMHSVVGRVHSRPALFRNTMLALTQLGVITDTCRWTLPVPLTPLPLRSDASRRSGRGSVRVPSGPRPRALQFFGLFSWGWRASSLCLPSPALLPHPVCELRLPVAVLPHAAGSCRALLCACSTQLSGR